MKHLLTTTLLLIFISNISFGQDLRKLDERRGFKRLVLGLSLQAIKEREKLKHIETDKRKQASVYTVKNLSDFTISGFEPEFINLLFFREKLMHIVVKMPNQPINVNGELNKAHGNLWIKTHKELIDTYGREVENTEDKIDGSYSTIWRGSDVTLFFTRYKIASDFTELGFKLDFFHNGLYRDSQLVNPTPASDF